MSSEDIVKQNGFKFAWEPVSEKPTLMSDGFFSMRGWQEQAFDELKDAPFMILNAPMGSGKSWMMCLLSACKMKKNTSLRCIIAVPQTIIAPGFANAKLQLPDGEKLFWCPKHNLCNKESSKGTVNYIKNWLAGPVDSLDERVLLCTHATLVKFYKRLRDENSLHLLENLLLWVDEAHHVKNIAMEDLQGPVISNGIGELVTFLLDTKMPIQMGLTTASFFRGDRCSLLTDTMEERFVRFNLPYDEYLQSMKHLESFSFDFLLCGHEYTKAIGNLAQQRKGKDIIYVPHRLSLINDVVRHLANITHTNKIEGKGIPALYDEYQSALPNILERYSIDSQGEEIGDQIWSMLLRRSLNMQGIDVKDIDISFVFDTHPLEGLLRYTSGACGINTFELLRKAIQSAASQLDETQIIDWVKKHIEQYGKKPGKHTGTVEFAEGEHKGITWAAIDIALKKGLRDLPGKSCLVKLIKEKLGIRSYHNPPALPTQLIIDWITLFINKYERKPNMSDGNIEFAEGEYARETWSGVNAALWRGGRGQPGKSSLASLIQENFGIKNIQDLPALSATLILDWIKQYIDVHGKKPNRTSGIIEPVSEEYKGITWTIINTALEVGTRGLPGGSSLAKLIDNKMGIANPMNLPLLNEELIINWVTQFINTHKEKPLRSSGVIEFASADHKGITWLAVDSALKRGSRGISGKSSLASLIAKTFSFKNHMNLSPLTEEMIVGWVTQYIDIHGEKPTQNSGILDFVSEAYKGITWLAINTALDKGGRELLGGSSLAKLIEKHLGIKNRTKSLLKIHTV